MKTALLLKHKFKQLGSQVMYKRLIYKYVMLRF